MTPTTKPHRYRPRQIALADGGTLLLRADGTIEHQDATGATTETLAPTDPAWPGRAIRFGLHEEHPTVKPSGRDNPGPKPPG